MPEINSDNNETVTETKVQMDVPRVRDDNFVSLYSNYATTSSGRTDFRLTFSEMRFDVEDEMVEIQLVAVSMSPQSIKQLISVLTENVKAFEAKNGQINTRSVKQ